MRRPPKEYRKKATEIVKECFAGSARALMELARVLDGVSE